MGQAERASLPVGGLQVIDVEAGPLNAAELVGWRLGHAHLAGFVTRLAPDDRDRLLAEARGSRRTPSSIAEAGASHPLEPSSGLTAEGLAPRPGAGGQGAGQAIGLAPPGVDPEVAGQLPGDPPGLRRGEPGQSVDEVRAGGGRVALTVQCPRTEPPTLGPAWRSAVSRA